MHKFNALEKTIVLKLASSMTFSIAWFSNKHFMVSFYQMNSQILLFLFSFFHFTKWFLELTFYDTICVKWILMKRWKINHWEFIKKYCANDRHERAKGSRCLNQVKRWSRCLANSQVKWTSESHIFLCSNNHYDYDFPIEKLIQTMQCW